MSNGAGGGEEKSFDKPPTIMYYINNGAFGVFCGWRLYNMTLPLYSLKVNKKETFVKPFIKV